MSTNFHGFKRSLGKVLSMATSQGRIKTFSGPKHFKNIYLYHMSTPPSSPYMQFKIKTKLNHKIKFYPSKWNKTYSKIYVQNTIVPVLHCIKNRAGSKQEVAYSTEASGGHSKGFASAVAEFCPCSVMNEMTFAYYIKESPVKRWKRFLWEDFTEVDGEMT